MTKNSEVTMTDWRIVVMGVSGCGKSSVGLALAEALGARFIDGDDLHPEANKAKMAAGIPLNDDDRWPWLDLVGEALAESNTLVACSALKRVYRERILAAAPGTFFVHLHGTRQLLAQRMNARPNHFMPVSLLDSQLNTLELLSADEPGVMLDIALPIEQLVAAAKAAMTI
jgi:carbohydrate kinase (thermoresistant glucokinase family)